MPTIECSFKDLKKLIGKPITYTELEKELILYVKGEIESKERDNLKIEVAETNRPDLWSTEGIAREIKCKLGLKYNNLLKCRKSGLTVKVHPNLKNIRPRTSCAVVKNVKLTNEILIQLIQLQEKICNTFGAKREQVAIGVYDYNKITGPIEYKAYPKTHKFIPLEFDKELTLSQILQKHPKGREYGKLLEKFDKYPLFIDSVGQVLSMPPIINSNHTGKVTLNTKNLFIECSGFDDRYLDVALDIMVLALHDRGGIVEGVNVDYGKVKKTTPFLEEKSISLNLDRFEKISGLRISQVEAMKLLKKSNFIAKAKGKNLVDVKFQNYRQDIMHQVDIMEDLLITYGYNNLPVEELNVLPTPYLRPVEKWSRKIAGLLAGTGGIEVMNYMLTNKEDLQKNVMHNGIEPIEISNPVSKNWNIFRTWLIPGLMHFLSKNIKQEYPQRIFEIGEVVLPDANTETKTSNPVSLAFLIASADADFTTAKQAMQHVFDYIGLKQKTVETKHDSFIPGRVGRITCSGKTLGYVGEINPEVLANFGMELPVVGFELNLTEIVEML
ncbi:phenylalanine--tRNA ligase subunit beta [Candidatus Woesearchaeota archaeon]|nr:phenylalanine--tRNA ligase subunit beta [Candidatus Woesearchaeota archaeon]